jgi:hypothetical protein
MAQGGGRKRVGGQAWPQACVWFLLDDPSFRGGASRSRSSAAVADSGAVSAPGCSSAGMRPAVTLPRVRVCAVHSLRVQIGFRAPAGAADGPLRGESQQAGSAARRCWTGKVLSEHDLAVCRACVSACEHSTAHSETLWHPALRWAQASRVQSAAAHETMAQPLRSPACAKTPWARSLLTAESAWLGDTCCEQS